MSELKYKTIKLVNLTPHTINIVGIKKMMEIMNVLCLCHQKVLQGVKLIGIR